MEEAGYDKPADQHFDRGRAGHCGSPKEVPYPEEGIQEGFLEAAASKPSLSSGVGRVGGGGRQCS